jgi:hypothetical protein
MTVNAMTRLLDMDQFRQQDYVAAKQNTLTAAREAYANGGSYTGLNGFDSKFNTSNNPAVYQAAALAAAQMPYGTWSRGLSADQQRQAIQLAQSHWSDFNKFIGPNEQLHVMGGVNAGP